MRNVINLNSTFFSSYFRFCSLLMRLRTDFFKRFFLVGMVPKVNWVRKQSTHATTVEIRCRIWIAPNPVEKTKLSTMRPLESFIKFYWLRRSNALIGIRREKEKKELWFQQQNVSLLHFPFLFSCAPTQMLLM